MKTKKKILIVSILIIAALAMMTACDLSGISDALKTDISKYDVTFEGYVGTSDGVPYYMYTGQEIKPEITIEYVDRNLEEGKDFTAEYLNNVNIGQASVKITGSGNFKGEITKEFLIADPHNPPIKDGPVEGDLTYIFSADGAQVVGGLLTQYVKSAGELVPPTVKKDGYDFVGWTYESQAVDFTDTASLPQTGATFVAQFAIKTYTVNYHLDGGVNSSLNKSTYTVEDIFELQDAARSDMQFAGWYTDSNFKNRIDSLEGVTGNLDLYAKFVDFEYKKLTYATPNGVEEIPYEMYLPNTPIAVPEQLYSDDNSKKLVWYLDGDMTHRLNNALMPNADLTLYSRWEDNVYAGFLDKGWQSLSDVTVASRDDMQAFIEYVYFTGNTSEQGVEVTYVSGKENILNEFQAALKECTFPRHFAISYGAVEATNKLICNFDGEYEAQKAVQASVTVMQQENYYKQIGDVFCSYTSTRDNAFDDFAINRVTKTYECSTSDELFYVLSHGYRPTPVAGSSAETVYGQFKDIMREICDDNMTDLQKVEAIYDWLILNVCYDYKLASSQLAEPSCQYKAFFLEGVLEGAAVCDGLSKAYSVMCAIEGIDCVRVTGVKKGAGQNDVGHAWNKVQLMGDWYLSDSTWGNKATEGAAYEYVGYEYFLFTDGIRADVDGYASNEYGFYLADSHYDYYSNYKMQLEFSSILGGTYTMDFDLYINGDPNQSGLDAVKELSYVLEYIDKNGCEINGAAFEIKIGERVNLQSFVNDAYSEYHKRTGSGYSQVASYVGNVDGDGYVEKDSTVTLIFSMPS